MYNISQSLMRTINSSSTTITTTTTSSSSSSSSTTKLTIVVPTGTCFIFVLFQKMEFKHNTNNLLILGEIYLLRKMTVQCTCILYIIDLMFLFRSYLTQRECVLKYTFLYLPLMPISNFFVFKSYIYVDSFITNQISEMAEVYFH